MDKRDKLKIKKRLEWLDKEIMYRKKQLGDPVLHHHYMGYLEAADGMLGERRFLLSLMESDKEKGESTNELRTDITNNPAGG